MPDALPLSVIEADETLRLLRDSARGFLGDRHRRGRLRELRETESGWDREVWRGMAELGWLAMRLPEDSGGLGLGADAVTALAEEIGGALLPEPLVTAGLLPAMVLHGAPASALRDRLLAGVLDGSLLLPVAWQSRADQLAPEPSTARIAGQAATGLLLTGTRRFVPAAIGADGYLVAAERDGGIGLAFVAPGTAGLAVAPRRLVDGSVAATLRFEGLALPPDALLAEDIGAALTAAVEEATLALAAQLLGLSGAALDMTADYLRTRVQFGQPLASFQVLQHRMVDLSIERRLAASTVRNAARVLAEGDTTMRARAVSLAKARCSQAGVSIAKDAVQLHGAIGFTDEADIGLHLRVALRVAALHGGAAAHRARFARLRPTDAEDE